jgi:hypothetical protein
MIDLYKMKKTYEASKGNKDTAWDVYLEGDQTDGDLTTYSHVANAYYLDYITYFDRLDRYFFAGGMSLTCIPIFVLVYILAQSVN